MEDRQAILKSRVKGQGKVHIQKNNVLEIMKFINH